MAEELPVTTLLAWAWTAFAIEADNAVEVAGAERERGRFRISLATWANGLRPIDAGGVSVAQLRSLAGAGCNLGGLERWGWIRLGDGCRERPGYGTSRGVKPDTVVRLTAAGTQACGLWPRVLSDVEQRWRARFGTDSVDALCETLRPAADGMPWAPQEVHPSDGFRTKVVGGGPVADAAGLGALLGAVLAARTVQHEHGARVGLPLAANTMRVIGADTVAVREIPRLSGLAREATVMATGYLARNGLATAAPGRAITLTDLGLAALEDYRARAARSDGTLRAALLPIISRTDLLAEGLRPPEGCWRSQKPYSTQTQRLLTDPTAALPWHPMVLHRGGWPDGS